MTATIIQPEYFKTDDFIASKYKNSADCINTKSTQGRNATPLAIFNAVRYVLTGDSKRNFELDVASDSIINTEVKAERFFDLESDGFSSPWIAETVFMNPPGTTVTGGTYAQRLYWLEQMELPKKHRGNKPKEVKVIKAAHWYKKLYQEWISGNVKSAIALCYRGGSVGSLGIDVLSLPLCITCSGAKSPVVNGSGRFAFEIISNDERIPETSNTQSSTFHLFPSDKECVNRFKTGFSLFGAVKI